MKDLKTQFTVTLIATLFIAAKVSAQVSNVESVQPMEGVVISKAQISQQHAAISGEVFKDCNECPEMVVIPAGSFLMGSPDNHDRSPYGHIFGKRRADLIGLDNEKPQHLVQINSFAMGKFHVTQLEWNSLMNNNQRSIKDSFLPENNISWTSAQLFVKKLSDRTGKKYRLPTEAEFEYSIRAGSNTQFFWGNEDSKVHDFAWINTNSGGKYQKIGLKPPNQFGLFDIVGNIWQWTQDCWNNNYIGAPLDGSSWTTGDCSKRVVRGGAQDNAFFTVRSAYRANAPIDESSFSYLFMKGRVGLRVVRSD